jgi:hypothetical protein
MAGIDSVASGVASAVDDAEDELSTVIEASALD